MTMRKDSKKEWNSNGTVEHINSGSLQRIADACELMAKDRQKLINDYEYMRRSRDRCRREAENWKRKYAAQKGLVTKLKKAKGESNE